MLQLTHVETCVNIEWFVSCVIVKYSLELTGITHEYEWCVCVRLGLALVYIATVYEHNI